MLAGVSAPTPAAGAVRAVAPARRPTSRSQARRVVGTLAALAALALAPFAVVQAVGQAAVVADPAEVPETPVALVLGAGLTAAGTPSPYLARRLDAAVDLYARGAVRVVLVSGDHSTPYHDEPSAMLSYLVEHGVPETAVVRDHAGLDTHDSCVRARQVFGVERAVVVTQDYHLRRALFSCTAAGLDVSGVGVSAASARPAQALVWHVRELPASTKAAWDALTRRSPVHLGPPEPGVREALDAAS